MDKVKPSKYIQQAEGFHRKKKAADPDSDNKHGENVLQSSPGNFPIVFRLLSTQPKPTKCSEQAIHQLLNCSLSSIAKSWLLHVTVV